MTYYNERMTEEQLADGVKAIGASTLQFRRWLKAHGGMRDGFYAVCPCCGNPYLYLDIDDGAPCPICLAPATAVAAKYLTDLIAQPEGEHAGVSLREARRNYLRFQQVFAPGHPRHAGDGPRAPWFEGDFMCLTAELRPCEWDLRGIAEDYFDFAKRQLESPRAGFWRVGGEGRPQCVWRACDERSP